MNTAPAPRPLSNAYFHFSVMDISMLSVDGSFTETPLIPVFNTVISEEVRAKETHWKKQFFAVSDVDVK